MTTFQITLHSVGAKGHVEYWNETDYRPETMERRARAAGLKIVGITRCDRLPNIVHRSVVMEGEAKFRA